MLGSDALKKIYSDLRVEKITVYKGAIIDGIKLESFGAGACKKTRLFGGDNGIPTEFTLQHGETIKSIYFGRRTTDTDGWQTTGFMCNMAIGRFQIRYTIPYSLYGIVTIL